MLLASWKRFLPVVGVLAATAVGLAARSGEEVLPPHADLSAFPMQIGNWTGRDVPIPPDELAVLGPGQFLMRNYAGLSGEPSINLYIAFFPSQRTGDTIHSPKNCLPGAGWVPLESGRISLRRADGSSISIDRYIIANGDNRDLVYYWYQAHGRVTPSEYWAKIFLVEDAIRMNRTDGALVRVVTPIGGSTDREPAEQRALKFVHSMLPRLDDYIPR
jgi:EpsI family protein